MPTHLTHAVLQGLYQGFAGVIVVLLLIALARYQASH